MRRASTIFSTVAAAAALLAVPAAETPVAAEVDKSEKAAKKDGSQHQRLQEYCRRAAALSPLDADAHFELGSWASENGLVKQARRSFEQTVAIDADHLGAREALGYVRHGTGWVLASSLEASGDRREPQKGTQDPAIKGAAAGAAAAAEAPVKSSSAAVPAETEPPAPGTAEAGGEEIDATVEAAALDPELAAKKEWAAAVSERMQSPFETYEDSDFLVHTTLPSLRHPKVLQLIAHLKATKKLVASFLGVNAAKTKLWPAKVQFLLLRSEEQYEQFAELVDDEDYAKNPDGGYTKGEHTVLANPVSPLVVRRLAEDAVERLHGRERRFAWWIVEGSAEWLVSQSKMTAGADEVEKQSYYRHFKTAADLINAKDKNRHIDDLLQSRELKPAEKERERALAMTLVDFLYRSKRKGFYDLLAELKSASAPVPPAEEVEDQDAWNTYWLNVSVFQEKALDKHFRKNTHELDVLWKKHVLEFASKHSAGSTSTPPRGTRGRNRE
jgi:hypothetical protein